MLNAREKAHLHLASHKLCVPFHIRVDAIKVGDAHPRSLRWVFHRVRLFREYETNILRFNDWIAASSH